MAVLLRCWSGIDFGFEALQGGVVPGVGVFAPAAAFLIEKIGEIGAAEALFGGEIDQRLGAAVEVEHGLLTVARPLHAGDAFAFAVGEGGAGVDEHGVHDAVLLGFLGAVAGVEVAGGAFVFEDDCPGDRGGVRGEEGATGLESEGIHKDRV